MRGLSVQRCKAWLKASASRRKGFLLAFAFLAMLSPAIVRAGVTDWFLEGLASLFELLTQLVGYILFIEVKGLIEVASYSNFVAPGPTAVKIGWVVARDLANMFFILILLVIAFATIVGYEEYHLRKLLPKLLIMAVVINFSKTITGIFIDLGQVIMLTFVNGFKDAAGGNFLTAFQIQKLLELKSSGNMGLGGLVVGMMLAFIMVSIATAIVMIMLITLVFRLVMLWVLIILSPIAFLASTIPPGQKYYSMWWDELKRYIIYGPVVAFFLWLALLTAQVAGSDGIARGEGFVSDTSGGVSQLEVERMRGSGSSEIPTQAGSSDVFISMIIFTSLLFAGLKVATSAGGVAGGALRGFRGGIKKGVKLAGRVGKKVTGYGLRVGGASMRVAAPALRGIGGLATDKIGKIKWAQNKYARGAGKAFATPFKLATGTMERAGRVAGVHGRRITGTGGFAKAKKALFGSEEERAEGIFATPEEAEKSKVAGRKQRRFLPITAMDVGAEGSEKRKELMAGAKKLTENDAANEAFLKKGFLGRPEQNVETKRRELQKVADEGGEDSAEARNILKAFEEKNVAYLSTEKPIDPETGKEGMSDQERVIRGMKMKDIPFGVDQNEAVADHMAELISRNPRNIEDVKGGANGTAMQNVREAFKRKSADAKAKGEKNEMASLAVDSLLVGALKAEQYKANAPLREAVGRHMNPQFLLKHMNPKDPDQLNLGRLMMADFQRMNPERAEKLNATGQYSHLLPERPAPATSEPSLVGTAPSELDFGDGIDLKELELGPAGTPSGGEGTGAPKVGGEDASQGESQAKREEEAITPKDGADPQSEPLFAPNTEERAEWLRAKAEAETDPDKKAEWTMKYLDEVHGSTEDAEEGSDENPILLTKRKVAPPEEGSDENPILLTKRKEGPAPKEQTERKDKSAEKKVSGETANVGTEDLEKALKKFESNLKSMKTGRGDAQSVQLLMSIKDQLGKRNALMKRLKATAPNSDSSKKLIASIANINKTLKKLLGKET